LIPCRARTTPGATCTIARRTRRRRARGRELPFLLHVLFRAHRAEQRAHVHRARRAARRAHRAIALAFLSQLVAARARDFVGTMTSTFTSLIQRWRGSAGLDERFKFLWNELPAASAVLARGRTAINDAVPMRPDGTMIEQYEGPYSWNRFDPRLNSAWMREWPESFVRGC